MKSKKKCLLTILSIFSIFLLILAGFIYQIFPYPVGRRFHYSYTIEISNVSGPVELVIPVPITNKGEVLSHLDYGDKGIDDQNMVLTENGPGIQLTLIKNTSFYLEGTYNAHRKLSNYDYDGVPVLSMSTLNHTYRTDYGENPTLKLKSSKGNISVILDFEAFYAKYKSWTPIPYHIRGGQGKDYRSDIETVEGWGSYPIDIGYIEVD